MPSTSTLPPVVRRSMEDSRSQSLRVARQQNVCPGAWRGVAEFSTDVVVVVAKMITPACDSAPGRRPKPPSAFCAAHTCATHASTSMLSSLSRRCSTATAHSVYLRDDKERRRGLGLAGGFAQLGRGPGQRPPGVTDSPLVALEGAVLRSLQPSGISCDFEWRGGEGRGR